MKYIQSTILALIFLTKLYANNLPIYTFPMLQYPQNINYWLLDTTSTTPLINPKLQQIKFNELKSHYYGVTSKDQSPWSKSFVSMILRGTNDKNLYKSQSSTLLDFNNAITDESASRGFGINYLPYDIKWLDAIKFNMNIEQLKNLKYSSKNLAIVTCNTNAYAIPTNDPWYLDYTTAGNGFPFNNNLLSSVYIGTSLYVIAKSLDSQWLLVQTPQFIGWIDARTIAYVDNEFINQWNNATSHALASIIAPHTSIYNQYGIIVDVVSSGTMLPVIGMGVESSTVYLPIRDNALGIAKLISASVKSNSLVKMPLLPTYANFKLVISQLLGRTYGWGGFLGYNDCSADIQAIFTPFGFFMPRNSSQQLKVGEVVDLSTYTAKQKMDYLVNNAMPMVTLIYIQGHIMLYVGNVKFDNQIVPAIYENVWGMRKVNENSRYIIGKSVLFPLMLSYKESTDFISFLDKPVFKLSILNVNTKYYNMANLLY